MSKIALVTDSTSSIPDDIVRRYGIHVLPQVLIWGEETYEDGIDILPMEFYTRLSSAKIMPTTSQATPNSFIKKFQELKDQGYTDVINILVSSKLSGTQGSYNQAKDMFTGINLHMVDSLSTAMGLGFQIIMAARALEAGGGVEEAIAAAKKTRDHSGVILTPETLEFLHRGGRIGGASRFLGAALNIKPILELQDGRIEPVERVRTRKKVFARIVELIQERIGDQTPVRVAALHANASDDANTLLEMVAEAIPLEERIMSEVSPVVGTHTGPGTVGIAFVAGIHSPR